MRRALVAIALVAVFAATAGTAPGGGSDNTEILIIDSQFGSDSNELVIIGEVLSSSKCEKGRSVDLVVKLANGKKVVDSGFSSERGAFALVLKKEDTDGAEKFLARTKRSTAGGTTCEGAREAFQI